MGGGRYKVTKRVTWHPGKFMSENPTEAGGRRVNGIHGHLFPIHLFTQVSAWQRQEINGKNVALDKRASNFRNGLSQRLVGFSNGDQSLLDVRGLCTIRITRAPQGRTRRGQSFHKTQMLL